MPDVSDRPAAGRRHFAFFLFPDFGHVNPALALTRELVARGHRVTHVTDHRFAELVGAAGASRLVGYSSRRGRFGACRMPSADEMGEQGVALLVETIETVHPLALTALADDVPDVVLYDFETFAAARMAARAWHRPTVQFSPNQAANEVFSWRVELFGTDHPSLREGQAVLEKFLAENGVEPRLLTEFAAEWDRHNIVFMPREFQTRGETFDGRFVFVGPAIADPPPGGTARGTRWSPPPGREGVVLVSLGTESNRQPDFFRMCFDAFDGADRHVVMTLGRGFDPAGLGPAPANVELHQWLPHLEVLPHADAFVNQGGTGSVMESLHHAVPMVVVPQTVELLGNGRRVNELRLGRLLHADRVTAGRLRLLVEEVAGDPAVAGRLESMRATVRSCGGPSRAADEVERVAAAAQRSS